MSWNYRLVRKTSAAQGAAVEWFDLHEVHYDGAGEAVAISDGPVTFGGDNPQDVIGSLERALDDARRHPVFERPGTWKAPSEAGQ